MSRPKRVKKTTKNDECYVYFKKNQSARTCEATGAEEESNMENGTRMTDFYSKECNDGSPDYTPGMELEKNQKIKKANIRKRKRDEKSDELYVDGKFTLTNDTRVENSNDDCKASFSSQFDENLNSGFNASNERQNNEIPICRQKTSTSMTRRRGASAVGHVDSSRPTQLPVPGDVPRKGRTTCSRKRKKNCEVAQSPTRNIKRNYTVIIEWLGLYSDEESDQEDVVYLVNKRSERRKKLKMIKSRNYRQEYLHKQSSSSSDCNESSSCANIRGNYLVYNVENHTDRKKSPTKESEELPARTGHEGVATCKLQGTYKSPSSDEATNVKSEAPVEAEPVDNATTSARYDVEDIIDISD